MKIKLTYLPGEEREAAMIECFASRLCGDTKVHKSDAHPPFKHVYLTTPKPAKPTDTGEST